MRASATARRLTLSCTTPAWWSRPARPVTPVWRRRRKGRRRWRRWWGGCWRGTQVWSSTGGLQRCSGHERAFFFGAIFSRTSKNDHSICQDRLWTHTLEERKLRTAFVLFVSFRGKGVLQRSGALERRHREAQRTDRSAALRRAGCAEVQLHTL